MSVKRKSPPGQVEETVKAATESAGRLFVGTSGWAYTSWKPGFYPATLPAKRFLEHYASRLNSLEVNCTFRAPATKQQVAGWLAAVPGAFRFCFKAPQAITHRRRLRNCEDVLDSFLGPLAPVRSAGQLGYLLFQLPPNFKADIPRLQAFLQLPQVASAGRVAFEFRHTSWFCEETWSLLRAHGVGLCVAESEMLQTPEVHTAPDFACYRLREPGGYTSLAVADHAAKFQAMSAMRDVFVYYKHEDEPTGPLAAEAMLLQAAAFSG